MQTCPACQREVQEELSECPHCGVVFTKWKGHKAQTAAPVLQGEGFYPLPVLSQTDREDLVRIESFVETDPEAKVQDCRGVLNEWGIYTEVKPERVDRLKLEVYVARKHLFPAKVIYELDLYKHLNLTNLASQALLFRQKLLVNAMVATAKTSGAFKRSLFHPQALSWYQTYAKLTDQQMQSALATAPQAFQASSKRMIIVLAIISVICISILWRCCWSAREDPDPNLLAQLLLMVGALSLFGFLYKLISLVRSGKKWQP